MKVIDRRTIITRAVKENNPNILKESGKSLHRICEDLVDVQYGCIASNVIEDTLGCLGLGCSSDNCPFYYGHEGRNVNSARRWVLSGEVTGRIGVANKNDNLDKYFSKQEDVSLSSLLSKIK